MFLMTSNITVGQFKPFNPNAVSWRRSVDDYSDQAKIRIPAISRLKRDGDLYTNVQSAQVFTEGMKVEVRCGYDGNNILRFKGFVRRINFTVPLEIECEGYSYQLRKKEGYTQSYSTTTVKDILNDLVDGTDIKLSDKIPDIPLKNIYFKNVKGTDVLEYLKQHCLLTVFFIYDVLYCGLKMAETIGTVKHRLGWNVIKDSELKFETNRELATVNIQIEKRDKDGTKKKAKDGPKDGSVKVLKIRHIYDEALLKEIAQQERQRLLYKGYEGSITSFLVPNCEPGMASQIDDTRYPERKGTYFIEKVEGSFGIGGGRQKIGIGALLSS
jgi:hypothetical protein